MPLPMDQMRLAPRPRERIPGFQGLLKKASMAGQDPEEVGEYAPDDEGAEGMPLAPKPQFSAPGAPIPQSSIGPGGPRMDPNPFIPNNMGAIEAGEKRGIIPVGPPGMSGATQLGNYWEEATNMMPTQNMRMPGMGQPRIPLPRGGQIPNLPSNNPPPNPMEMDAMIGDIRGAMGPKPFPSPARGDIPPMEPTMMGMRGGDVTIPLAPAPMSNAGAPGAAARPSDIFTRARAGDRTAQAFLTALTGGGLAAGVGIGYGGYMSLGDSSAGSGAMASPEPLAPRPPYAIQR